MRRVKKKVKFKVRKKLVSDGDYLLVAAQKNGVTKLFNNQQNEVQMRLFKFRFVFFLLLLLFQIFYLFVPCCE